PGRCWFAQGTEGGGRRLHEDEPGGEAGLGEARVLGEEAIARMHGLRPPVPRGLHDLLDGEIALRRRGRAQEHRLVGRQHVQRLAVGLRVDRHRADPQLAAGPDDADGDLAAIGDEDLREGGRHEKKIIAGWRIDVSATWLNAGPLAAELPDRFLEEGGIDDLLDRQQALQEAVLDPPLDLLLDIADPETAVAVLIGQPGPDQLGLGPRVLRGDLHYLLVVHAGRETAVLHDQRGVVVVARGLHVALHEGYRLLAIGGE